MSTSKSSTITKNHKGKSSINMNQHQIFLAKTVHARFHPVHHSFNYPLFYFGVWLTTSPSSSTEEEHENNFNKVSNVNNEEEKASTSIPSWMFTLIEPKNVNKTRSFSTWLPSVFTIKSEDYLGDSPQRKQNYSFMERLKLQITELYPEFPISELSSALLMTTPRVFGYSFNPLSVYFLYDKDQTLLGSVLEVNNTFREKHIYLCHKDLEDHQQGVRAGYDKRYSIKRSFHVSPFNNRSGIYECHLKDPLKDGFLDILLLIQKYKDFNLSPENDQTNERTTTATTSASMKKHLMARVYGDAFPLTSYQLLYLLFNYPINAFLTVPRIMYEAYLLAYRHKLPVFQRPNPYVYQEINTGLTVQRKPLGEFDRMALQLMLKFLHIQVEKKNIQIIITLLHGSKEKEEFIIKGSSNTRKDILIFLRNTWLCKRLLLTNTETALSSTFVRKEWDCSNQKDLVQFLALFIDTNPKFNVKTSSKKTNNTRSSHYSLHQHEFSFIDLAQVIKISWFSLFNIWVNKMLVKLEERWFSAITNFDLNPYTITDRIVMYEKEALEKENLMYSETNMNDDDTDKDPKDVGIDDQKTMSMVEKERFLIFKRALESLNNIQDKKNQ